jgi:hypothetical protein
MNQKCLSCIALLIFVIALLCSCTAKNNDIDSEAIKSDEIWACINEIPSCFNSDTMKMVNISGRQQYCYISDDGSERIVLEIQLQNNDEMDISEKESVKIGKLSGISYIYDGEPIEYTALNSQMVSGILHMESGECVIEWTQAGAFCRLYGTFSRDEMLEIAASVEVSL